jgi:hypothetical protein
VTDNIIAALTEEEAKLQAELNANATFRRLEAVRSALQTLKEAYTSTASSQPHRVFISHPSVERGRQPNSITSQILRVAESALRESGQRMSSGQILRAAEQAGVTVNGKKPSAVVASVLSHDGRFVNRADRRGSGYGLREWSAQNEDLGEDREPNKEFNLGEAVS